MNILLLGLVLYSYFVPSAPKFFKENKQIVLGIFIGVTIYQMNLVEGIDDGEIDDNLDSTHTQCYEDIKKSWISNISSDNSSPDNTSTFDKKNNYLTNHFINENEFNGAHNQMPDSCKEECYELYMEKSSSPTSSISPESILTKYNMSNGYSVQCSLEGEENITSHRDLYKLFNQPPTNQLPSTCSNFDMNDTILKSRCRPPIGGTSEMMGLDLNECNINSLSLTNDKGVLKCKNQGGLVGGTNMDRAIIPAYEGQGERPNPWHTKINIINEYGKLKRGINNDWDDDGEPYGTIDVIIPDDPNFSEGNTVYVYRDRDDTILFPEQ